MATIGLMIEGQEDLTWERFFQLAQAAEDLGFESLFRSDHLTALEGFPARRSLDLWTSLTALALRTRRLRFGPLVCSLTFDHPALIAKKAAALAELSGGRFELGLGAGWYKGEHRMFGLPYPPYTERLERLDEGARVIKMLWAGRPADFTGRHYALAQAETHPSAAGLPLIMGGKNEQRTLRIIAEHADEWNCTYIGVDGFARKSAVLDEHCRTLGRQPGSLRRSLMLPFVIGRDAAEVQARIDAQRAMFPSLPADLAGWRAAGYVGGAPAEVLAQLKAYEAAGAARVLVQHNSLDDLASLELLAGAVLPHFA
ncbi:MAG: TIGR03560 family F420-dependent LLM class oxidoreductase [Anaerolineales bacterium]|nr:TIGR03560 family F420-dependent LLM class oxidoreductase [Anaerolineales bacterium]